MNHKVHSLIIFIANQFSSWETANPINQEARILDLVVRPIVAKKFFFEHAHSVHFVHYAHVVYRGAKQINSQMT